MSCRTAYPRHKEIPFDSTLKRMITVHEITWIKDEGPSPFHDETKLGKHAITVKGAPDLVLQLCTDYQTMDDQVRPLDDEMRRAHPGCQ